ncbi:MAG: hypothetical protein JNJ98_00995, partial [Gemmatimonadetes bacterium]|nr:hypothetical protein [Gemmatimonadota bacterium]
MAGPSVRASVAGDTDILALVARMSRQEKIGQLQQVNGAGGHVPDHLRDAIRDGRVGAVLNEVQVETVNEL